MKIVNKKKFLKAMFIFGILILAILIFSKKTYSKGEIEYKENYIYYGDTLWSISKEQIEHNKYFENKDIRDVVYELKELNNFNNSQLNVGEKIIIPTYK